jgi:leucyl aminopeptidase
MRITVAAGNPNDQRTGLLAVPVPAREADAPLGSRLAALDRASEGRIAEAIAASGFRGSRSELVAVPTGDDITAKVLVLVGVGAEAELDAAALREAAARVVRHAATKGGGDVTFVVAAGRRVRGAAACHALAEGAVLGSYRFDRHRTGDSETSDVERLVLLVERASELRALRKAAADGEAIAASQNLARDLSNEPPNVLPPVALADVAKKMAKEVGLAVRVTGPSDLARKGFGAMLAVAQGSANEPRLIVLEHNAPPKTGKKAKGAKAPRRRPTICLVGKGVCFDSGGLSLKPAMSMVKMKHDMSGGAAVVGAMRAIALLKLPLHVIGVVGAVENMPSGTAYRVDDIVTSLSGQTVEISNTDAEGRLVLADCLHYAATTFEPDAMIDLATLTGACGIALGPWAAAVIGSDDKLSAALVAAGEASDERYWPLPLWDVHRKHMKSRIADLKQTGGRDAGTTTAAAFLSHFVGETPWIHLDIASVADTERATPLQPPGATGFGVRSLVQLLQSWGRKGPMA